MFSWSMRFNRMQQFISLYQISTIYHNLVYYVFSIRQLYWLFSQESVLGKHNDVLYRHILR